MYGDWARTFGLIEPILRIVGDGGSAPESVVATAIEEFNEDRDFDSVFCVFDKDEHTGYEAAIERIKSKRLKRASSGYAKFHAITSVPCFEFWLLLHFRDTDAPFARTGELSAAENVVRELRRYIPLYAKGYERAYENTRAHLNLATERAERVLVQREARGGDNPSTRVHELIRYLRTLAQP